jgi:hypothetical protein
MLKFEQIGRLGLENLLKNYKGIEKLSNSEHIYLAKDGLLWYKDFADTTKDCNAQGLFNEATKNLRGADFKREAKRFADIAGAEFKGLERAYTTKKERSGGEKEAASYKANKEYTAAFLEFFGQKTGASKEILERLNVFQLHEYKGVLKPLSAWINGTVYQPLAPKQYKRFSFKPQETAFETVLKPFFGLFNGFAAAKHSHSVLIVEGETDAICAVGLGFKTVSFGGGSKSVNGLLSINGQIQDLGLSPIFFFDFDKEGRKYAARAAAKGGLILSGHLLNKHIQIELENAGIQSPTACAVCQPIETCSSTKIAWPRMLRGVSSPISAAH